MVDIWAIVICYHFMFESARDECMLSASNRYYATFEQCEAARRAFGQNGVTHHQGLDVTARCAHKQQSTWQFDEQEGD